MTTLAWFSFLVLVAVGSFFAGSAFTRRQYENDELEKEVEQAKSELAQYKQDISDHLAGTNKLVAKMKDNYEQLSDHIQQTNKLLLTEKPKETMPFFSKETTEQLKASIDHLEQPKSKSSFIDEQPVDYAVEQSGIFANGSHRENSTAKPA